jgi:hypothetical protein
MEDEDDGVGAIDVVALPRFAAVVNPATAELSNLRSSSPDVFLA